MKKMLLYKRVILLNRIPVVKAKIKVELDLFDHATYSELKGVAGVITSKLFKIVNLANLKSDIDKVDIDKLETIPANLSNLSNVVKKEVVKKTVYNEWVKKVNAINTSGFVLKTQYNTNKWYLENKISDTSKLVKKLGEQNRPHFFSKVHAE